MKGDEGIFLGYYCRIKAYKCLNFSTHKIIESAHVRINEFAKKSEEESSKEPRDYKKFFYYKPNIVPNLSRILEASTPKSPKSLKSTELHLVQPELQSEGPKSQSDTTKLVPRQTELEGLESQTMGLDINIEYHEEVNGIHS